MFVAMDDTIRVTAKQIEIKIETLVCDVITDSLMLNCSLSNLAN